MVGAERPALGETEAGADVAAGGHGREAPVDDQPVEVQHVARDEFLDLVCVGAEFAAIEAGRAGRPGRDGAQRIGDAWKHDDVLARCAAVRLQHGRAVPARGAGRVEKRLQPQVVRHAQAARLDRAFHLDLVANQLYRVDRRAIDTEPFAQACGVEQFILG
ncbi:hypothetical protein EGY28_10735 [Burkholderia dolosa]|nr:hypothetical protein EGY28_10735 [Burkholderia dolosa]